MAGTIDVATKQFLKDKTVAREIINLAVPGLLAPSSDLKELNPEEIAVLFGRDLPKKERLSAIARFRDLLFSGSTILSDGRRDYVLVGIENQSHVDFAMPVRVFLENAVDYAWQVQRIADRNRKEDQERRRRQNSADRVDSGKAASMRSAEFLSGLRKTDRLKPVITIVVYWSTEPWAGPRHLQELIEVPAGTESMVDNNTLIILEPARLRDQQIASCTPDLRLVLEILKHGENTQRLEAGVASDPAYGSMNTATVQLIEALTGASIRFPKGATKMIPAIEQIRQGEREQTLMEANREWTRAMVDGGISIDTIANLMKTSTSIVQQWLEAGTQQTSAEPAQD